MLVRLGRWQWKSRLRTRLFVALLLVIVPFQILLTAVVSGYFTEQYERQTRERGMDTLHYAAYSLLSAVSRLNETADALAYNSAVQEYLNITPRLSDYEVMSIHYRMERTFAVIGDTALPGVHYALFHPGRKGVYTTFSDSDLLRGYDISREEWYRAAQAVPSAWRLFVPCQRISARDKAATRVHITVNRVKLSSTLRFGGYLLVYMDETTFAHLIGELPSAIQNVVVKTAEGQTLYSDLTAGDGQNAARLPLSLDIAGLNWNIECTIDASEAKRAIAMVRVVVVLTTLALTAAMLWVVYRYAGRVTKPLGLMATGMTSVRLGRYDVRLPVATDDELGSLTESFNGMAQQLGEAKLRLKRYEVLQQSMSFYALQQQIHPHFLYNTLDMMIGMATQGHRQGIIDSCTSLAAMFRYALSTKLSATLQEELTHIRNYFLIIRYRNLDRIEMEVLADPPALLMEMPRLTLQPLVENSVKHGFGDRMAGGRIRVTARSEAGRLCLRVEDNGTGFSEEALLRLRTALSAPAEEEVPTDHIGILNVHARLRLIYRDDFTMLVENNPAGGAAVSIRLPGELPVNNI